MHLTRESVTRGRGQRPSTSSARPWSISRCCSCSSYFSGLTRLLLGRS